jgi:peptide/nickel transport system substrate-binding protein
MNEHDLRDLLGHLRRGELPRRRVLEMLGSAGLGGSMAGMLLAAAGRSAAQGGAQSYPPTRRGGGGLLRVLWWQAPTLLNPHFAAGQKDLDAARIFYEPLAGIDPDGHPVPILAAAIPSVHDGGVAPDGRSVIWKLKRDVTWHDGRPFSADDVVFTWEYVSDPATAAISVGSYSELDRVEKIDAHTVRLVYRQPTPFWARPFVGPFGLVLPKHLFDAYRGAKSRDAPSNLKPVGTGPYRFVDFKPGDHVRGELYARYHEPNRPHFDAIELKGGGDAVSAARAVLQTGEFDYAWNMQVEDELLERMERGGRGRVLYAASNAVEHMMFNFSDPWTEVDGERSNPKTRHPILSEPAVRDAIALLVDRASIQRHVYGRGGIPTRNFLNNPARFRSPHTKWEYSVDKANQRLDEAGWARGSDGVRRKNGRRMKLVFQTSTNAPRQKCQQIVKQSCQRAGVEVELKSVVASVFFSSDLGNPDTATKFYADLQMLNIGGGPDPWFFMNQFCSWEIASKANKWSGRNMTRWRHDAYDEAYGAAATELDPIQRAALFVRMNELLIEHRVVVPIVNRPEMGAASNRLRMTLSGWDSHLWLLKDWYRDG